ncbi:hypothetical protein JCM24511_07642 [Saitozyma sp. JCM 24511]|nr:hypothetical protein JCM24511_07642 [Saitozyma sp. JCM 24511]
MPDIQPEPEPESGGGQVLAVDHSHLANKIENYEQVLQDAAAADRQEHKMGGWETFKAYRKAAFWSAILSTCLVMEGFDLVVIGSFYGQPAFQQRFGTYDPATGGWLITAEWQTGLSNGALVGEILGIVINGYCTDKFGYKPTVLGALVAMAAFIFIPVFAQSLTVLVVGEILQGIPWGIFQVVTTAYAADVCPINLRAYLTTFINMCWGMGIFLSSGITLHAKWSSGCGYAVYMSPQVSGLILVTGWRLPFCLQWIWPPVLFTIILFAPESPWWLVRQGRFADAEDSCRRLSSREYYTPESGKRQVAYMIHTTAMEREESEGARFVDCFRGKINLRRTEIVCAVFTIQWWCGDPLISYAITFYEEAGLDAIKAFDLNLGVTSMYIVGTLISWPLVSRFGRRTIYLYGLAGMGATMLITGILGFVNANGAKWAIGTMLILLNLFYNMSVGPACYVIISETHSTRLRAKSIVLARNAYNITGIITNTITPRMISPLAWGWGARCGLFWFGTCVLSWLWCLFRLPETKGRSYGELDILFNNRVEAWKFARTKVDRECSYSTY